MKSFVKFSTSIARIAVIVAVTCLCMAMSDASPNDASSNHEAAQAKCCCMSPETESVTKRCSCGDKECLSGAPCVGVCLCGR